MRATNQGGSLAGFIIIGVLLALVLVGGLYGLNRYNAQQAANETVAQEEKKTETKKSSTETSSSDTSSGETTKTDTETKQTTTTAAPSSDDSHTTTTTETTTTNTKLPHTGPADSLMSLVAVAALAFAGAHYNRSRARR